MQTDTEVAQALEHARERVRAGAGVGDTAQLNVHYELSSTGLSAELTREGSVVAEQVAIATRGQTDETAYWEPIKDFFSTLQLRPPDSDAPRPGAAEARIAARGGPVPPAAPRRVRRREVRHCVIEHDAPGPAHDDPVERDPGREPGAPRHRLPHARGPPRDRDRPLPQPPSGDPTPNGDDVALTARLCEAGTIMGIDVLDHMILAESRQCSFKEMGRL